jgi:carbohydrate kinase (thermoresistant glucokinase family)
MGISGKVARSNVKIIVMGISGVGKTTVGQQLANLLHVPFLDADSFHSAANVQKMQSGQGLTDEDRMPWLASIAIALSQYTCCVLACSALKRIYRDMLASPDTYFVYLKAPESIVLARVNLRQNHFAGANLIKSQLADLEDPSNEPRVFVVDTSVTVDVATLALLIESHI